MSLFKKVLSEHEAARQKVKTDTQEAKAKADASQVQFEADFVARATEVAVPLFEEFVVDAKVEGFPAEFEPLTRDGYGNPHVAVKVPP